LCNVAGTRSDGVVAARGGIAAARCGAMQWRVGAHYDAVQ